MKNFKLVLITLFTLFILIGCAGPRAIRNGFLRDTIFSVEPRNNGMYVIWMVHDDVGRYCTADNEIALQALAAVRNLEQEPNVLMQYESVNAGDPEYGDWLQPGSGCGTEKGTETTTYRIISITYYE